MMPKKTILIAEDNGVNRQILKKILSSDYEILEAANGKICLDILHHKYETISAVLLDIVMPVLDGYEVLEQMRKETFLSNIPVIVASGQNSEDAEIKALSLGANDYILKPYRPEIIKHRVANTIYLKETSAFVNSVQRDRLTGVYGKDYFFMKVEETLRSSQRRKFDLICFDIERFKFVNDRYGMKLGDDLLRHIGQVLLEEIDGYGFCGRLESDEFGCLIQRQKVYRKKSFTNFIDRVNAFSNDINLNLILRYGIYVIEDPETPVNIMCDRAMLAKESIKGKYDTYFAYYDDAMRRKLLDEQMIISDAKIALEKQQFQIYFQPKYDLKTEEIIGAEALARWMHPVKGFLSPSFFIPLFEKNGFITDLDYCIWEQCCQKMRAWIDKGNEIVPISINVSRVDIYDDSLSQRLISLIQKYGLSPRDLHLEITESAYTENPEQLISVVSKLKKLGFVIEMDDFGTGYSSLNMLSELPIDILKLDMRFIQKEEKKSMDRSVLSFTISLAKWMNLQVVAEGVETLQQVQLLQSFNCEYAQGYYFAKPLSQEDFEQHLLLSRVRTGDMRNRDEAFFNKLEKEKYRTLLVLDDETKDYPLIFEEYGSICCVEHAVGVDQALSMLEGPHTLIGAVIASLSNSFGIVQAAAFAKICNERNVPVIAIYGREYEFCDDLLDLGFSDYVARPYKVRQLGIRLKNAIASTRMEKFEQEKEINAAIIEMRKRAEHDALTGLLNRAEYEVRIDRFFYHNDNPEGIFIILDVDNFKTVNDTFGHVVGDKVLHAIGKHLCEIFPETEIVARIGGDEFSLFIPYILLDGHLESKMIRLCNRFNLKVQGISVSCSAGVCYAPAYGTNHEDLYINADLALLTAKRKGKSQFVIFSPDIKIAEPAIFSERTMTLLDEVSDVMFVSDVVTSEVIYLNEVACKALGKSKIECVGKKCYDLFWDRCRSCDRCEHLSRHNHDFYEETTFLKDGKTPVHIKARVESWENRKVKVHYLRIGSLAEIDESGVRLSFPDATT
ncbi:MAG: EAL domain-containing protein [Gordonibacter sp.]|nr:EAL domain-containing protein [Gordonibacter sp.]